MITGKTVVAGVTGRPVAHSLSPILHNAWLAAAGIDGKANPKVIKTLKCKTVAEGKFGTIPLGHYCRQSLKEHMDTAELVKLTKQSFAFFEGFQGLVVAVFWDISTSREEVYQFNDGRQMLCCFHIQKDAIGIEQFG